MLAVIKTGGKQYLVSPGQKIKIEKISKPPFVSTSAEASADKKATEGKEGSQVIFDEVLLLEKNKKVEIGTPFVKNAKVIGKVLKQAKAKKVIVFKYKSKKRYKKKQGHRQAFTEVEITEIRIRRTPTKENEKPIKASPKNVKVKMKKEKRQSKT